MIPGSLIVFGRSCWLYMGLKFTTNSRFMYMYLTSNGDLFESQCNYAEIFGVNVIAP
jgi:hypothetical protein